MEALVACSDCFRSLLPQFVSRWGDAAAAAADDDDDDDGDDDHHHHHQYPNQIV